MKLLPVIICLALKNPQNLITKLATISNNETDGKGTKSKFTYNRDALFFPMVGKKKQNAIKYDVILFYWPIKPH